jgi:hypothetical protein
MDAKRREKEIEIPICNFDLIEFSRQPYGERLLVRISTIGGVEYKIFLKKSK